MTNQGTVYVVDDDASLRKALSRLVAAYGHEAKAFSSANEFLADTQLPGPSCMLLDVCLPGLNGLELQSSLISLQRTMPIIFLTAHGTVPDCARAMRDGALDFFQKPVGDKELLDAVERALEISRCAHEADDDRDAIRRRLNTLTRRESEVLTLVVTGMLNKQIAYELGAAEKTIKVHRGRVMVKMGAKSVADLVRMLHKLGWDTTRP